MNFFEAQEHARRRTGWLVFLFTLAVSATVLAVYAAARILLHFAGEPPLEQLALAFWNWDLFWRVAVATVGLISVASLYKSRAVAASADSVALTLGGRALDSNTREPYERRLLNVVEEMAIASGTPVPTVYVLPDEPGINAFAAGLNPSRSTVAVTDGCLKLLTRDELQGVVAHEFSHLLNGDSRLNLRLMGLVHGILVIGLIGSIILRSFGSSRSSRSQRKGGLGSAIFFAGLSLYVIGAVGVFFTRLIKAAVSRQRELLADASGVQFTRNPPGLAGALKKIGGLDQGSTLIAARAEEASHFFFSEGISRFTRLLSTHPLLSDRIRRLDPQFQGEPSKSQLKPVVLDQEVPFAAVTASPAAGPVPVRPRDVVATVGTLGDEQIAYAQSLLARLPQRVRESIQEPWVARAVVLALLLDRSPEPRAAQLNALLALGDAQLADQVSRAHGSLQACPVEARLPILDLAMPALRRLSSAQYGQLRAAVKALVRADSRVSLFEYTLQRVLLRHLSEHFAPKRREPAAAPEVRLDEALSVLLSAFVHAGGMDAAVAARAFAAAQAEVSGNRFRLLLLAKEACNLGAVDRALSRLADTAPRLRRQVLSACVAAVATDRKVTISEGELLRAVSESLGCPMPPLLPGQHVEPAAGAGVDWEQVPARTAT
jgi:Zn-dependent protease with chaperone function